MFFLKKVEQQKKEEKFLKDTVKIPFCQLSKYV